MAAARCSAEPGQPAPGRTRQQCNQGYGVGPTARMLAAAAQTNSLEVPRATFNAHIPPAFSFPTSNDKMLLWLS